MEDGYGNLDMSHIKDSKKDEHVALVEDLHNILEQALLFEFHDFKNRKYATPKIELVRQLTDLIENVKNGKYDN